MWYKFWKTTDKAQKSSDNFRIKVIALKNGTKKYYPQYKHSNISSDWMCIIKTFNGHLILVDISEFDLVNSNYYCQLGEDQAREIIEALKQQLVVERSNQYESEDIIKL